MKKVKLKVLKNYKDLDLKRNVRKGETITVTEERAKAILRSKDRLAEIVQVETNPLPKASRVMTSSKPIIEGTTKSNVNNVSEKEKQSTPPPLPKVKKSKAKNAQNKGKED